MSFEYKSFKCKVNYLGFNPSNSAAMNDFINSQEPAYREQIGESVVTVVVSDTELDIGGSSSSSYVRVLCPYSDSHSSVEPAPVSFKQLDKSNFEWGEEGTGGLSMDNDFLPIMLTAKVPPLYDARAGWNGSFYFLNSTGSSLFSNQTFVDGYSFADFYSGWRSIPLQLGLKPPESTTYIPIKSDFLAQIAAGMDLSEGKSNYIGIEYLFELGNNVTWSIRSLLKIYNGLTPYYPMSEPYLSPADWGNLVYTVDTYYWLAWKNGVQMSNINLFYSWNSSTDQEARISLFIKVPSGGVGQIWTKTWARETRTRPYPIYAQMATWVEKDIYQTVTDFVNDLLTYGEDVDPDPPEPPGPEPGQAVNPYEPAGGMDTTDTGPTEGTFTPIHDDVDWTPHLDNVESIGLTRWYACDQSQINLLGQRLLSTNVLMEIAKYFVDFKSLIINLMSVPFLIDPVFNCEAESDIGFAFLGLPDQVVMTRGRKIKDATQVCSFGRITVPRFYGNFIDYKYTTYEIYLPYFGVTALDPELVAGHEIDLTYVVDLLTGDASIQIQNVDNYDIISILNTHLNESICLSETSSNSVQLIEALLSTAAPIAGAGAALAGVMIATPSATPTQPRWEMPMQSGQEGISDGIQYQDGKVNLEKDPYGKVNLEKDPYDKQTNVKPNANGVYSNYQNAANDGLNSLINYRPHLTGSSFSSMSSLTGKLNPQKAYLMIRRPELVQSSNQSLMGYPCYIGGEIAEFVGTGYTEFRDIRFEGEFLYSSQDELTLIKEALRNGVIL